MLTKNLFIFVEGQDDKRFFEKIILPILKGKYVFISIRTYANEKNKELAQFIRSLKQMNTDYIFVVDKNSEYGCITTKKKDVQKSYDVEVDKIIVVIKEIESWYLAGLNEEQTKKFGLPILEHTENVGKKKFEEYRRNCKIHNRKDLMTEILKNFSIKTAKQKKQIV
jgi:hypothetical protein